MAATWSIRSHVHAPVAEWDWTTAGIEARDLIAVRRPASTAQSRHVPVSAFCQTTAGFVHLESGLEHQLFRELDRRQDVEWIVGQPVRLDFTWPDQTKSRHVPDLLSITSDGQVKLWDCRPVGRIDAAFNQIADATRTAASDVGWTYEVFSGATPARQANVSWLTAYRHAEPWHGRARTALIRLADGHPTMRVGHVTRTDASDEVVAVMWHLLYTGEIKCDLDLALSNDTVLSFCG